MKKIRQSQEKIKGCKVLHNIILQDNILSDNIFTASTFRKAASSHYRYFMGHIVVHDLYKVFGDTPKKGMELLRQGLDKDEIQKTTG